MKWIAALCAASSMLMAYQKGDAVDAAVLKTLSLQGDKVYAVDFFASWCGSCRKEIPLLSRAAASLDPVRAEIVGVDVDKDPEEARAFQAELKAQGALGFRVVNDPMNLLIRAFDPVGMPSLYYVKSGKVIGVIYGAVDDIDEVILNDLEGL